MKDKWYYVVGEAKTGKILGFNLTEEEKDELFYNVEKSNGHRGSENRFYSAFEFKVKDLEEVELLFKIRNQFKNINEYSYVILSDDNEWLITGKNEDEKTLLNTIIDVKADNPDVNEFILIETIGDAITV